MSAVSMKRLPPNKLQRHFYAIEYKAVVVPPSVTMEQILEPTFWSFYAGDFKAGYKVWVAAEDQSFAAELVCTKVGADFVRFRVHSYSEDEEIAQATAAAAAVAAEVSAHAQKPNSFPCIDHTTATKWRVLGHTGAEVATGLATKGDAERVLAKYVKDLGAKEKAA